MGLIKGMMKKKVVKSTGRRIPKICIKNKIVFIEVLKDVSSLDGNKKVFMRQGGDAADPF